MTGITFNSDGTKMFLVGLENDKVYEYDLCHPYSMGGAKHTKSFSVGNQDNAPQGMAFKTDGTKMFILGEQRDKVFAFTLLPAYDVSEETLVYALDISDQELTPSGIEFSSNGKQMFIVGRNGDEINAYGLATAWDISTANPR